MRLKISSVTWRPFSLGLKCVNFSFLFISAALQLPTPMAFLLNWLHLLPCYKLLRINDHDKNWSTAQELYCRLASSIKFLPVQICSWWLWKTIIRPYLWYCARLWYLHRWCIWDNAIFHLIVNIFSAMPTWVLSQYKDAILPVQIFQFIMGISVHGKTALICVEQSPDDWSGVYIGRTPCNPLQLLSCIVTLHNIPEAAMGHITVHVQLHLFVILIN